MRPVSPPFATLAAAAAEVGLLPRGGFHPEAADAVPALEDGRPTATLLLLGNVGDSLWTSFAAAAERGDGLPDPLDRWSRRVIDALADRFAAHAVYPFDGPPWLAFQRWAMRAEPVFASPMGPLVHARHGQWHAYRGALLFAARVELPAPEAGESPCLSCAGQACLHACPVDAMQPGQYHVDTCAAHLQTAHGADCLQRGCLARRACPVAPAAAYPAAQQSLHMQAFLDACRRARG